MFFLFQAVAELGFIIYTSLDFGLNDGEERQLSPGIENLLDHMTSLGKTTAFGWTQFGWTELVQKFQRSRFSSGDLIH